MWLCFEFNCLKHFVLRQAESRRLLTISRALQPVLLPASATSSRSPVAPRLPSASSASSPNCLQLWLFPQKIHTHTSILWAGRTSTTTCAALGLAHTFHTSVFVFECERINARLTAGDKHWQFVMLLLRIFRQLFFRRLHRKTLFFIINVLEYFFPAIGSRPHWKHCPLPAEMSPECMFVFKMCVRKRYFLFKKKKKMNDSVTDFNSSERISESPQQLSFFFVCATYK